MKSRIPGLCAAALAAVLGGGTAVAAGQQPNQQQPDQQRHRQQKTEASSAQAEPATQVRLSQLEQNPEAHIGRRVIVSGEVGDVLGPRVFKIDEANWADLDGEILVVMDTPLAALVKEEDPITVTGTMRRFVDVRLDREWGWLDLDPEIEARVKSRPVLVATSLVGGDPELGMMISVESGGTSGATASTGTTGTAAKPATAGTSGTAKTAGVKGSGAAVTDLAQLAKATDNSHVGRRVNLTAVRVDRTVKHGGFWVKSGGEELFILPADSSHTVQSGQTVTIEGHVLRLPEQMESRLEKSNRVGNEEIYVYARSIKQQ